MVRCADDFVLFCRSPEATAESLRSVQGWGKVAGLTLQTTGNPIVDSRPCPCRGDSMHV